MSVTYGFYDSVNGDRKYNSVQISQMFDGIIADGIFETFGDKFMVSKGSGMTVYVGSGRGWFNHTWILNDSSLPITIGKAEQVLNRIDTIVIDVNALNRINDIIVVKGTPASNPVPPTLTNDYDAGHRQYPLCDIYVGAEVTEIAQDKITNRIGTDTPFATGPVQPVTTVERIWKNEKQTEAFQPQDIMFSRSIKYSDVYDALYIRCRLNAGNGYELTVLVTAPLGNICHIPPMDLWNINVRGTYVRGFKWEDNKIIVGNCTKSTSGTEESALTVDNNYAIPIAIYGIKWGRFISP